MEGEKLLPLKYSNTTQPSEPDEDGFIDGGVVELDNDNADEPTDPIPELKSTKRLISDVWDSFDKIMVGKIEKAICKHCKAKMASGSSSGTSHLRKHLNNACPGILLKIQGQTQLKMKSKVDGSVSLDVEGKHSAFDQEASRSDLMYMVVMHEYSLCIVEHIGFIRFVLGLNPLFKMISRHTLKRDIVKKYIENKKSLHALLEHNKSRVSITTDMWTASNQRKGYMVVTTHFIDEQWILRNRTLRFCYVPCPHTKGVLAKVLMESLSQYSLENKLACVVVDNCSTNDGMVKILLEKFERGKLMLHGDYLHMHCSAHILNLVVQDGLDVIKCGIEKVRECVSFWMATPKRIEKFDDACRFLNLPNPKRMDCKTRWNSTFLMLQTVLPFKDVFTRLKRLNKRMKFVVPSETDWTLGEMVCEKLEIFYKTTKCFSGRKYATINLFFRKICVIRLNLKRWLASDVEIVRMMANSMIGKFDKYWCQISGTLAVAAILDPRNKLECVEYYFEKFYSEDGAEVELKKVRKIIDDLVVEYERKSNETKDQEALSGTSKKRAAVTSFEDDEDEYAQVKKTKRRKVNVKCEVDDYLKEDPLPDDAEFDILYWWKTSVKYPTLRMIARDILAIPVSTVASESSFSTGGRVLSPHRSRLHSETVEVLMCLQNWMMEDIKVAEEAKHAYSTVVDDSDTDNEGVVDVIDMDLDDDIDDDSEE